MTSADSAPPASAPPVFSPLHDVHVAAGALFTDFAGWQMPVRYSGDLAEHRAVREAAGLFDLSHMAEVFVEGDRAAAFLDYALAGQLSSLAVGQAKYSLLLAENGGIVDDVVVYRLAETEYLVVANAGNHEVAVAALTVRADGFDVVVDDRSDALALIAVQGPRSLEVLQATDGLTADTRSSDGLASSPASPASPAAPDARGFAGLKYYWVQPATFAGEHLLVARTGYTGEDGFELYIRTGRAAELWNALALAGESVGLVPAGLAARDTLRLEAGMPLYGHELGLDSLPAQAGLGRVPNLGKGEFVGREAIERASGAPSHERVLVGLVGEGRRAARAGYEIFAAADAAADAAAAATSAADAAAAATSAVADEAAAGTPIGVVTSGVLSPTLGVPVAMAYLAPDYSAPDTVVAIDVRGTRLPFRVTPVPFYRRKRD